MRVINVPLADRSYSIKIGPGLLSSIGRECVRLGLGRSCAIITDRNVGPLFGLACEASLAQAGFRTATVVVPAGETSKALRHVERCYNELAGHRLDRKSFVVALGGGVVGDLAGFVAATYLRGIDFVQVPTTLLAQVDSSVGGKVGVNLKAGKNLVGAFHQPRLVICDLETLGKLPEREYRSGLAEVIKYGIIRNSGFFNRLERQMPSLLARDIPTLSSTVGRCCQIKAEVVGKDETESGFRAILNFGHTIGHGLEALSGYGRYLHGEAISVGQVAAARISARQLGLPAKDVERIRLLFEAAGLPVWVKWGSALRRRLLSAMKLDKKSTEGEVKFVLVPRVGECVTGQRVSDELVDEVLSTTE